MAHPVCDYSFSEPLVPELISRNPARGFTRRSYWRVLLGGRVLGPHGISETRVAKSKYRTRPTRQGRGANSVLDIESPRPRAIQENQMSMIEHAIASSRKHIAHHDPSLANKPAPKMAILTCMDPRLNDLLKWLDIEPADADVIRNVGTAATEDVVRSLMFLIHVLGVPGTHDRRAHGLWNGNVFGRRVREPPPHAMRRMGSCS